MMIYLDKIYYDLEEWRDERKITAESQKAGYLINVMKEFGYMAVGLKDYANWSECDECDLHFCQIRKEMSERVIVDALCKISVFTINAGEDIPCEFKHTEIELKKSSLNADYILKQLVEKCALFSYFEWVEPSAFNIILANCAYLCEHYGFNFEIAMNETIKEISSRTGSYDKKAKKWIKDTSDEARAKWYQADYEKGRIKQ